MTGRLSVVLLGAALAGSLAPTWAGAATTCTQAGQQAVDARWQQLADEGRSLGDATGPHQPEGAGCSRAFAGGNVYWSEATGAWEVLGGFLERYLALAGPAGVLQFPTAAPAAIPGSAADAREQAFTGGRIYGSGTTGVRALTGAVLAKYLAVGGPTAALGLPTAEEADVAGGTETVFQGGRIYRSEPTGAQVVSGPVLTKYLSVGGPAGLLGFPTAAEASAGPAGSRVGVFTGGRIYWSEATQAWVVHGPILTKYLAVGAASGRLGLPTSSVRIVTGGLRATFQKGHVYWSSATGAHVVEGAILSRFVKIGAGSSYIGMPIGEMYRTDSGWKSRFRYGAISYLTASKTTKIVGTWRPYVQGVTAAEIPYTYRSGCPVGPSGLRRVMMPYYDWSGVPRFGKLIVRTSAADDMQRVFQRAFSARFPIRRMNPVDVYQGSDITAMEADNTSAFNCRKVTGNPYRLSQHSYGNAIDINTFENPYVTSSRVYPSGSRTYLNRGWVRKGMIVKSGPIARGMAAEGWPWGARWSHPDYQHFSSNGG